MQRTANGVADEEPARQPALVMRAPGADGEILGARSREDDFIAAVMATNALAIDAMLPALPDIGRSFGLADELQTQWVLTSYLLGFGAAQIVPTKDD